MKTTRRREGMSTPTIAFIQAVVAAEYGVTVDGLRSSARYARLVAPRHVAMYLCRELTSHSSCTIGRQFGNRDHSTVMHGCRMALQRVPPERIDALRAIVLARNKSLYTY
jgi:chromosomal replication initiator protein